MYYRHEYPRPYRGSRRPLSAILESEDKRKGCLEKGHIGGGIAGEEEMTVTEDREMSMTKSLILCGLEKKIVEYLTANQDDRYLTVNRLALALGSHDSLVSNALKMLEKNGLVRERINSDTGMTTYRAVEKSDDPVPSQTPKVVTPTPIVTEKEVPEPNPVGRPEGQSIESQILDAQIKRMYPKKGIDEIATELKLTYGAIQGRIQRLRDAGEITEYIPPERRGGRTVPCPECGEICGNKGGLTAHMRNQHGIKRDMDKEYAEVDKKIKQLYPAKGPTEIAKEVGVNAGIVSSRLTKMHKSGEITEYWNHSKPSEKSITTSINQTINTRVLKPTQIQEGIAENKVGSFNIGQLLKVNSENQVAIVNATLEVIDERGSQYEVSIIRTGKGDGSGPIPLEFSKEVWQDLDDALDYHGEYLKDMVKDEDLKEDDLELHRSLVRQLDSVQIIRAKIRRDVGIPKEEEQDAIEKSG